MNTYNGICACPGRAKGKISLYTHPRTEAPSCQVIDILAEQSRFKLARYIAVKELSVLCERAHEELGESAAMIFHIHQLMLDDDTFTESVCGIIESKHICAEAAVSETADTLTSLFSEMSDGYMSARGADIRDICDRVNAILSSASTPHPKLQSPAIIVAKELSPSELLLTNRQFILGLALTAGAANSHASILTRKMNIPTLCELKIDTPLIDGTYAELDADNGIFMVG